MNTEFAALGKARSGSAIPVVLLFSTLAGLTACESRPSASLDQQAIDAASPLPSFYTTEGATQSLLGTFQSNCSVLTLNQQGTQDSRHRLEFTEKTLRQELLWYESRDGSCSGGSQVKSSHTLTVASLVPITLADTDESEFLSEGLVSESIEGLHLDSIVNQLSAQVVGSLFPYPALGSEVAYSLVVRRMGSDQLLLNVPYEGFRNGTHSLEVDMGIDFSPL